MKQYYISRTGGEIRFSYTPSSAVSWTVTSETPTTGWFTTGATSGVLSIRCGEAVGTDSRSIELRYTVNGMQCNSIKVIQNGINVPCSCSNMPLTWSVDTSTFSSLPSEGTTFYATYDNSRCINGNVSFEKKYNKSWWTIDDSVDGRVTVTINDVGTRSGDDLFDNIIYKINGEEPACEDTQFRQRSWCSHLTAFGSSLSANIPQSGMTSGTQIGTWSLDSSTYNNKLTVSSPTLQVTYTNGSIKLNQAIPANTGNTTISYIINAYMAGGTTPCSSFTIVQDSLVCSCADLTITSDISGNISAEDGLPAGTQIGHYNYSGTTACKSKVILTHPELDVTDTNGVLTLSTAIPPNTEASIKTFTVSAYLENTGTPACGSFTLTQDALPTCGCNVLSFDKALNHYTINPIHYSGGSFTYQYNVAPCEGNKTVTFAKGEDVNYYQLAVDTTNHTLTVTVDAVGDRTGTSLNGSIKCYMNNDPSTICGTITFSQNLAPCDCDDLTITLKE